MSNNQFCPFCLSLNELGHTPDCPLGWRKDQGGEQAQKRLAQACLTAEQERYGVHPHDIARKDTQ